MKQNKFNKWRRTEKIILGVSTIGLVAVMVGYSAVLYFEILAEIVNIIIN